MAQLTQHKFHGLGYRLEEGEDGEGWTVQVWFPCTYSNDLGKTFQTRQEFCVSIQVGWDQEDWRDSTYEKMGTANGCVAYLEQQTLVPVSELADLIELVKAS